MKSTIPTTTQSAVKESLTCETMKQSLLLWSAGRRSTRTINALSRFQHLPTLGCGRPLLYGEKMSRQSKVLKSWLSSWSPCLIVTFSPLFPIHPFSSSSHPLFTSSYVYFVFLALILIFPVSLPISSSFFPFSLSLPPRFFHSAPVWLYFLPNVNNVSFFPTNNNS